ncbi:prolipoprotein diacylglyceryl transferase [Algibacillus agarilyticus]|uniref:prolipoprotein diacylglyceryl transferase n=1 Tax=Algibacillus agarilyticus TaxID=2234133 RepID=UPI000DCF6BFF|nr:prolipoprotein diacylglyceryl transferase [Algibacillus agarilyticus]
MNWNIDPVLFSIGSVSIHWYGALFASAIMSGFYIMKWMYQKEGKSTDSLDPLLMYSVMGIIVGARLGHCFFYDPAYYFSNPLKILAVWEGGLASHGGGIGVILALYYYHKKFETPYLWLLDRLAIPTALFGFFVRLANFFNSEIVGLPTSVPWGIVFVKIDNLARHPVQLYESIAYLTIFAVLVAAYKWTKIKQYSGAILGVFLCSVFSARFMLEFVKVKQAAYDNDFGLSTGQLLSIPFLLAGIVLVALAFKKKPF